MPSLSRKSKATKIKGPLDEDMAKDIAEEIAQQMVKGWDYITRIEFRNRYCEAHNLTEAEFDQSEKYARRLLKESWDLVDREDMVAVNLQRLEYIAKEAMKYKQMSVAQAAIATALKCTGADAPRN
jgi:hypothetical protein